MLAKYFGSYESEPSRGYKNDIGSVSVVLDSDTLIVISMRRNEAKNK